ncbi:MAG: recombinase family protein [Firmicutes bacterium]|nr:recombinase family protein [Bacillota bacterium]
MAAKNDFEGAARRGGAVYRTAVYLRLSKDDGDKQESDSIVNQRRLIEDFVSGKSEFCVVEEYVDDGWSGSNFDRPAFRQMYDDIECGAVNCVIVKDLSRFGRNYIEVGRYLERIFPLMGVRMIAVNDCYDSLCRRSESDALILPMKNLINDIYCRDISVKIKTQLEAKRRRGECVANFTPYGYCRDKRDRGRLVPDETTAPHVRQIFLWKLEGYSYKSIADKLNSQGVLSPYEQRTSNGEKISGYFKRGDKAMWSKGIVYRILHNECYIGTLVQGKWKKLDYRSRENVYLPPDEWTRTEGTHEAIVDAEVFFTVRELMKRDTRLAEGRERAELFSGFLFCGECGRQLVIRASRYKDKRYKYYCCPDCRGAEKRGGRIAEERAYKSVLDAICAQIALFVKKERLLDEAGRLPERGMRVVRLDEQLLRIREEIERYTKLKSGLYESSASGILTEEEYSEYSAMYGRKIENAAAAFERVTEDRRRELDAYREAEWIRSFRENGSIVSLDRPIIAELFDKIFIYGDGRAEIAFRDTDAIYDTIMNGVGDDGHGEG